MANVRIVNGELFLCNLATCTAIFIHRAPAAG